MVECICRLVEHRIESAERSEVGDVAANSVSGVVLKQQLVTFFVIRKWQLAAEIHAVCTGGDDVARRVR